MNPSTASNDALRITLEIVSEDIYELDLAVTNAIGRDLITGLQNDGYLVQLQETASATRGGDLVMELIQGAGNIATTVWMHKEVAERILNDSSTLVTLFSSVIPVIQRIFQAHKKRATPASGLIKITVLINGNPTTVEAEDLETADTALKLAQKYTTNYPLAATQITRQSKTLIKGTIPKQQRHKGKGK